MKYLLLLLISLPVWADEDMITNQCGETVDDQSLCLEIREDGIYQSFIYTRDEGLKEEVSIFTRDIDSFYEQWEIIE